MKIAVFHNLPSGGAKRALYNFVNILMKSNNLVDVFVPSTANEDFLPSGDVANKVYVFPVKKTITGLIYSNFRYALSIRFSFADLEKTEKKIAEIINKKDYDVVLSEQDRYTMSPFFLKYIKKPTVYYCQQPLRVHEAILQKLSQKRKQKIYYRFGRKNLEKYLDRLSKIDIENASYSKYIITNSYFSRESILRVYGLNSYVCYLGVDTKMFRLLRVPKDNFVLSVGSCTPSKGFDFIIRSLSRVDPKIRPKFIIVSNIVDNEWKMYLEQLAIKLNVKLEIKNLITNDELVLLYNKAKLVLYAPYLEPFGLVPLEAMACGTPVVAVKEGGVRESVIDKETGILTDRDENMFAEAVTELLLDEEKREKMGQKGIETVHNFWTLEHAGERLLKHLTRAIEKYEG